MDCKPLPTAASSTATVSSPGASGRRRSAATTSSKTLAGKEQQQLQTWLKDRPAHDKYGGLLNGPAFKRRAFSAPKSATSRWYLVTPEGHPFYSLGVNTVSADDSQTYVEGREAMFTGLPGSDDPLAAFYGKGDDNRETWRQPQPAVRSGPLVRLLWCQPAAHLWRAEVRGSLKAC